jgi:hypothetical protein
VHQFCESQRTFQGWRLLHEVKRRLLPNEWKKLVPKRLNRVPQLPRPAFTASTAYPAAAASTAIPAAAAKASGIAASLAQSTAFTITTNAHLRLHLIRKPQWRLQVCSNVPEVRIGLMYACNRWWLCFGPLPLPQRAAIAASGSPAYP